MTAATIVRVAGVAGQTLAATAMVLRDAKRVCGAGETAADGQALEYAEGVRSAGLASVTVVVVDTIGHRWFLARRQHRVPFVAILALAGCTTGLRRVRLALLINAADHFAAGIHAVAHTAVHGDAVVARLAVRVVRATRRHGLGRLATLEHVTRISLVAVYAQAG